ncbi:hypothetical protein E4T25_04295 [Photobacterium damselae subsp. piscicida]|uniref:hypothetical protein n=1 Tax=Photobacterium damselae TaxID=38293 RepID=UPI0010761ED0|nr:hypothetical protein [Photobacterium damselae]TFZ62422.1 hypothetical protein E4T25_04295 [Photobacterium damselae subsp. piscicida]
MKLIYLHCAIVGTLTCAFSSTIAAQSLPHAQLTHNDGREQIVIQLPTTLAPVNDEAFLKEIAKPNPTIKATHQPITATKRQAQTAFKPVMAMKDKGTLNNPEPLLNKPEPLLNKPIKALDKPITGITKPNKAIKEPTKKIMKTLEPTFYVAQGQSYLTAIRHWFAQDKLTRVAWSLPPQTIAALNTPAKNGEVFKGNIDNAIQQVSKQINQPLYFTQNAKGLSALHHFKGSVDIRWIHGATLKEAVKNLAHDYQWQWQNGDNPSWMTPDDYTLIAPYPIVAPSGDFAYALNTVIEGYPIQAQLLYATKNMFIVEKQ